MKGNLARVLALGIVMLGAISVASPAEARWYDGRYWHRGHVPHGWVWDPRLHYYVYGPAPVAVVAPPPVVVTPPPPPVVVAQPTYYAAPAYVAPAVSVGVHIR